MPKGCADHKSLECDVPSSHHVRKGLEAERLCRQAEQQERNSSGFSPTRARSRKALATHWPGSGWSQLQLVRKGLDAERLWRQFLML